MENRNRSDGLRQAMSVAAFKANRSASLGYVLIVFALGTLYLSRDIAELGLGSNADPGAKLFPVGLSIMLAIAGGIEIWKNRRRSDAAGEDESEPVARAGEGKRARALGLFLTFCAYIVAIPWLGFTLSTLVLATAMMMLLGARLKVALSVSIVLALFVNLLFVALFHVPLPTGVLGIPF